jgi:hypothetical protein
LPMLNTSTKFKTIYIGQKYCGLKTIFISPLSENDIFPLS